MRGSEQILTAMSGIGEDLVIMAEQQRFPRSVWQRVLPMAACLLIILGSVAGLKKLNSDPVYTQPPAETETPPEAVQPPEENTVPEEPAEEPPAIPYGVKELKTPAFYIFDTDDTADTNPSKAIAPDGTVLVSVEHGQIEPLIDQATGEYVAIMVYHRSDGQTIHETSYDIYNLEGEMWATGLQAYDVDCLGNVVMVLSDLGGELTVELFARDTYGPIFGGYGSGIVVGDCIWLELQIDGDVVQYVADGDGTVRKVMKPIDNYYVWNGETYFVTNTAEGMGLLDSHCESLLPEVEGRTIYGISNGYARCEDENGFYLMDIRTAAEVFRWEDHIIDAFEDFVVAYTNGMQSLILWDGNIVATGKQIRHVDCDMDGRPELYMVEKEDAVEWICIGADGTMTTNTLPLDETVYVGEYLSSRTAVLHGADGEKTWLVSIPDGKKTQLPRRYGTTFAILEDGQPTGLLCARWHPDDCADIPGLRYDIVREDGTVLLEGLTVLEGGTEHIWTRQGDVFYTENDSLPCLIRIDGTRIYEDPLE